MNPWLPLLSCWVQLLLISSHWDKPGIVNLLFPLEMSPWLSPFSCWVQLLLIFSHWDKPGIVNCDFLLKWAPSCSLFHIEFSFFCIFSQPVISYWNESWLPFFTCWIQLTLNFSHWYRPNIVNVEFPVEMSPWLSLFSNWVQHLLKFPIEMSPGYPSFPVESSFPQI